MTSNLHDYDPLSGDGAENRPVLPPPYRSRLATVTGYIAAVGFSVVVIWALIHIITSALAQVIVGWL